MNPAALKRAEALDSCDDEPDVIRAAPEAAPPPRAVVAEVTRVLTPGAGDAVEAFASAELVGSGRVGLVSLEVIAQQRGGRWALRRSQIQKYVEGLLSAELDGKGAFLQVSETDFLVSHPELEPSEAQVTCLGYLRRVFFQFLGSGARATDGLFRVQAISAGRIEARAVVADEVLAAEAEVELQHERARALAKATEAFVAGDGRAIKVTCSLEPVLKLNATTPIGFRLLRRVTDQADQSDLTPDSLAGLAGVDIMRIDWAATVHGLAQLRARADAPPPMLIVPVSYTSLSSQRGRSDMFALLKDARACAGLGVICEVSDLEGAPRASLEEAISLITPLALFVVGKLMGPSPSGLRALRGVGFRGLAFDCPESLGDAELLGWSAAIASRARQVARTVLLYGVGSERMAEGLIRAGATHATFRAAPQA